MDVDLLRPGTVPISKDTTLWFEFLLDPNILETHLNKQKPDPSPTELISKFLAISADVSSPKEVILLDQDLERDDKPTPCRRSRGLKILALKVAAFLNWDLDILEQRLPFSTQWSLLQDLLHLVHDEMVTTDLSKEPDHVLFAVSLYHRWALRATYNHALQSKLRVGHEEMVSTDLSKEPDHVLFAVSLYHRWALRATYNHALQSKLRPLSQTNVPDKRSSVWHEEMVSTDLSKEPDHVLFAVSLYHRWALRATYNHALQSKLRNVSSLEMQDDRFSRLEHEAEQSLQILLNIVKLPLASEVLIPSSATFIPLVEDGMDGKTPNWKLGVRISSSQFFTLILMDLATYLFYREDYSSALLNFEKCKEEFQKFNNFSRDLENRYFKTELATIDGYITACQAPVLSSRLSLTDRFLISLNHHYEGVLAIIAEDNLKREIPVTLRESLELDIGAAISSGGFTATRDLIFQIQSLNTVYKRAADLPCVYDYADKLQAARRGVDIFVWALKSTLTESQVEERERLSLFVMEVLESVDSGAEAELRNHDIIRQLIKGQPPPPAETRPPEVQHFVSPDFNNIKLKNGELEYQLMASYEPHYIKDVVIKLMEANAMRPVWQIENKWELGIPLHGIVLSLPSGILQHYLYVLLGKAKYLDSLGRYEVAKRLLVAAEAEVNHHGGMLKLTQLIAWEVLLVDSHSLLAEWPNKTGNNGMVSLGCLNVLKMTDAMVLPRVEVVEQAAITLLNLGEWEPLITLAPGKRLIMCDLAAKLAQACHDIVRFGGSKKISREAWDLIVPVLGPSGGIGRRGMAHEAPLLQAVLRFFSLLRDWTVLSAAISLLARLHNVLRDEISLELVFDHTALWPGVVSNTSSYNSQLVSETLLQLVNSALEYYPKNISLHKLLGDYYYISGQHSAAMKHYLLAAVIATDSFSRPLTKATIEDYVYKRMIKCLSQMNCHTQAGVLCQFLEEVDYNTAFKSLTECVCHDCMDTYYDCIWDVNILEYLIYLQNKRGNKDRAKKAVDIIGLLELNSNNNEEIKREAANKRKVQFMQALVRQYVL